MSEKAGETLQFFLNVLQENPQDYPFGKEISQPLYQNGQTALVCIHMKRFPAPVGVPLCEERVVHIGVDRSNIHAFLWPLRDLDYVLVCTDCLNAANGDIAEVEVVLGGTIKLAK